MVKPATAIAWHRAGFRAYWRWKSRPKGGRPRIAPELRRLIRPGRRRPTSATWPAFLTNHLDCTVAMDFCQFATSWGQGPRDSFKVMGPPDLQDHGATRQFGSYAPSVGGQWSCISF
jgi:hypothetical protein